MLAGGTVAKNKVVIGTGLITLDLLLKDTDDSIRWATGGSCGNVLSILGYLNLDVYPVARLNGDTASTFVRRDLRRWGVNLDFASLEPTAETPVITQKLRHRRNGKVAHSFGWDCPVCGSSLPWFKPILLSSVEEKLDSLPRPGFFYFDKVSPAAIALARWARAQGACVVFEPSGKGDNKLFRRALEYTSILKYSEQRFSSPINAIATNSSIKLEVQTCGSRGLAYRTRSSGKISSWNNLKPIEIPKLRDSAGAGDWCTAGIISEIARRFPTLTEGVSVRNAKDLLTLAQAYAAWACSFEGARGAMYQATKESFSDFVSKIIHSKRMPNIRVASNSQALRRDTAICPSCLH